MAGDIDIDEQIAILPPQTTPTAAGERLKQAGVRVMHRYGSNVLIVEPMDVPVDLLRTVVPKMAIASTSHIISGATTANLDPVARRGLAAFDLRQSTIYKSAKLMRAHAGAPWDTPGLTPPHPPASLRHLTQAPSTPGAALTANGLRMSGSIAVGTIIVSGPTPDLVFRGPEITHVVAEVQNGLGWQGSRNPAAEVTWTHDIHTVTVEAPPGGDDPEAVWRDPAMAALGYSPDWQGVVAYVDAIRAKYAADWSYVGYFTKYPLSWFAYASTGGPRLCIQYPNGGWGPGNIDRVFVHATGHIFQAPEEDGSQNGAGCWRGHGQPNPNCRKSAPGGVRCIMRSNDWSLCT